jgi:hypothetical protein
MAFLDFIRNRQEQSAEQSSQSQKPETAREMYARQAEQGAARQRSVGELPEADKTQAREIGARLDKATQYLRQDSEAPAPAPDSTGSPEPMRQNMMGQDNAAPDLSPTNAQRGAVGHEQEQSSAFPEQSSPSSTVERPRTLPRPTPSWER